MSPLRYALGITAVVAGPPLWFLVRSDSLDAFSALERAGLVAGACAAGLVGLQRLLREYARQARLARRAAAQAAALTGSEPDAQGSTPPQHPTRP